LSTAARSRLTEASEDASTGELRGHPDPVAARVDQVATPDTCFSVIMKDGRIYKNELSS
jgi:hypothetical protein